MLLHDLPFGAFLTYTPRVQSEAQKGAKDRMYDLKGDRVLPGAGIPMTAWIAAAVKEAMAPIHFGYFFGPTVTLVPVPHSSLTMPGTLWVPMNLATALQRAGLGGVVDPCLERMTAVPKAAFSMPEQRPTAQQHYDSLRVKPSLVSPAHLLLVDDVVTSGSTLFGAARRLQEAYPGASVRAFAAMRTISNPAEFLALEDPCLGSIHLLPSGRTLRRP